tara:strand:- start:501 stop:668 length:168 start_codon:yes stop_codon:yes gene_type:complete
VTLYQDDLRSKIVHFIIGVMFWQDSAILLILLFFCFYLCFFNAMTHLIGASSVLR